MISDADCGRGGQRVWFAFFVSVVLVALGDIAQGAPVLLTLAHFDRDVNGGILEDGVISDAAGNLYGTTAFGGTSGLGTVFRMSSVTGAVTTLASFNSADGALPAGALIRDAAGNLYGTTSAEGAISNGGTVFRLDAGANSVTTLALFNGPNGESPAAGVIRDAAGNLYGTTRLGGDMDFGTVFRIDAGASTPTTIASFDLDSGRLPYAGLVTDAGGNLYGTTWIGGEFDLGTVFRIDATTGALTTLVSFQANGNGVRPLANLIVDASGDLYGTTSFGGLFDKGTVFRVDAGTNALTTLASFTGAHGAIPTAGLLVDPVGNLYGTTSTGGAFNLGTVFRVEAGTNVLTTLFSFDGSNGEEPSGVLIADAAGTLFGTTRSGGMFGDGTVFRMFDVGFGVPEPTSMTLWLGAAFLIRRRGLA